MLQHDLFIISRLPQFFCNIAQKLPHGSFNA